MIGDTIETDIFFGKGTNVSTLLVLSGVTKENDLNNNIYNHEHYSKPDFIINNVFEIFQLYHLN